VPRDGDQGVGIDADNDTVPKNIDIDTGGESENEGAGLEQETLPKRVGEDGDLTVDEETGLKTVEPTSNRPQRSQRARQKPARYRE
jgi:hypothetical protein